MYFVRLTPDGELQTHRGVVRLSELIGLPWGSQIFSHQGSIFWLLQPGLGDLLKEIKRNTQIMYPKDIGYILVMMGIGSRAACTRSRYWLRCVDYRPRLGSRTAR